MLIADSSQTVISYKYAFEENHFAFLPEFDEAWDALEHDGYVVVCGPAGTGKTTLCAYLIFKYLKEHQPGMAYYIHVKPSEPMEDEIEFLKQHISPAALFIVDDQRLSFEEAEKLVQTFTDYYDQGIALAKLVVISSTTYGCTQTSSAGRAKSELNRATLVPLLPANESKMLALIAALKAIGVLNTPLSDDEIIMISEGNIALAVILAKCAHDLEGRIPRERLFTTEKLRV